MRVFRVDKLECEFDNGDKEVWCIEVDADLNANQEKELRELVDKIDIPDIASFRVRAVEGTLSCGRTFLMYREGFSLPETE